MSEQQQQQILSGGGSWPALEKRIDQFEQAWLENRRPSIEDFLPAGESRLSALIELVHVDMEWRSKRGEPLSVKEYLARYPELAREESALAELRQAEESLRGPTGAGDSSTHPGQSSDADPFATLPIASGQTPAAPSVALGYEIQQELGRGAMGVVFKAWNPKLQRFVALKMLHHPGLAGAEELARLSVEAQAQAQMHHPNIIQLYEMGEMNGGPYLVLELAEGGSLDQRLRETTLTPERAAELLRTLALAVAYAHQQKVIHRDLKPSNILLAADGTPKISDFGLAKKVDVAGQTATGSIMGTPSYMAPEQAAGRSKDIGPAADVYSLGAILYECLTGRPPFRGATILETLDQVRSQEPLPPRRLQPRCPRDLETITLKCLAKEAPKRYASATALADDLSRFLEGRAIKARSTSVWEHAVRWAYRRPAVAGLLALVLIVTVLGVAGITWQWRQTVAGLAKAEQNLYSQRIALADREWLANRCDQTQRILADCPENLRDWEFYYLQRLCQRAKETWLVGPNLNVAVSGHNVNPYLAVATVSGKVMVRRADSSTILHTFEGYGPALGFSPDGTRLASAAWKLGEFGELPEQQDTPITIWDLVSGKVVRTLTGHQGTVFCLTFSADGKRLASASLDGTARNWDLSGSGDHWVTLTGNKSWIESVAFSPDGQRLATAAKDGTLRLWDGRSGQVLLELRDENPGPPSNRDASKGETPPRSGGERVLPELGRQRKLWNAASQQTVMPLRGQLHILACVRFAPDGERIAAGRGRTIKIWDVRGRLLQTLHGHSDLVRTIQFHPTKDRLASGSYDQSIKVWDLKTGEELDTLRGHSDLVNAVAYSSDGLQLASAGWDDAVRLWDMEHNTEPLTLRGHRDYVRGAAFSPDGKTLATSGAEGSVLLWDLFTGKLRRAWEGFGSNVNSVAFTASGRELALACYDGTIRWRAVEGEPTEKLWEGHKGKVYQAVLSPDESLLASVGEENGVRLWDCKSGAGSLLPGGHEGRVISVAFVPGTSRLASGGDDGNVCIWDVRTREKLATWSGHRSDISRLAISRDGKRLASASMDHTVRVWDTATGRTVVTLEGHTDAVTCVAFSKDGRRLATSSLDRTLRLWDAQTGQELLSLRGHAGEVLSVAFSPDGWRLAATTVEGAVHVWDATPLAEGDR
jgi:eukaryotic-like serine/threonine-protein kinase